MHLLPNVWARVLFECKVLFLLCTALCNVYNNRFYLIGWLWRLAERSSVSKVLRVVLARSSQNPEVEVVMSKEKGSASSVQLYLLARSLCATCMGHHGVWEHPGIARGIERHCTGLRSRPSLSHTWYLYTLSCAFSSLSACECTWGIGKICVPEWESNLGYSSPLTTRVLQTEFWNGEGFYTCKLKLKTSWSVALYAWFSTFHIIINRSPTKIQIPGATTDPSAPWVLEAGPGDWFVCTVSL